MNNQSFNGNQTNLDSGYVMIFENLINTSSIIISTFGLITYITCFIYINWKLVLNSAMKNALKAYSVLMFVSYLSMTIGQIWQFFERNLISCGLNYVTIFICVGLMIETTLIISTIRSYKAWRATKAKIPSKFLINLYIIGLYIIALSYSTLVSYFQINGKIESSVMKACPSEIQTDTNNFDTTLRNVFRFCTTIICVVKGLVCLISDLILKKIQDKQNKTQNMSFGHELIPWKTTSDEDSNIPIKASIFSFCQLLCVTNIGLVCYWTLDSLGIENYLVWSSIILIWKFGIIFHLPLLIAFTIKQKSMVAKAQPPKGLQFYPADDPPDNETGTPTQVNVDFENTDDCIAKDDDEILHTDVIHVKPCKERY